MMTTTIKEEVLIGNLINGEVKYHGGAKLPIYNPAKGTISKHLEIASKVTVDEAKNSK